MPISQGLLTVSVISLPAAGSTDFGHTVAYACDIAKRTRTTGPLDENSVEVEIAVVKAAMAQAGPSGAPGTAARGPTDRPTHPPGPRGARTHGIAPPL